MKMRNKLLLLATLLTLLVAIGCQRSGEPVVRELSFAIENELTNLDPIKSQEPYSLRIIGQVFEGLVSLDGGNRVIPVIAESWSHNKNYTVWQFKIRKGVFFHTDSSFGPNRTRELKAEDVLYSFQRIVSKESYPAFVLADIVKGVGDFQAGKSSAVAGFRLAGPDTFEVELMQPEPFFLNRITSPWFVVFPREVVDLGPDIFGRSKAVGTGPFRLRERTDTEVVLEKNPQYWRQVGGNIERLRFKVIRNEQIRLSELRSGNVAAMRLPVSLIPSVLADQTGNLESSGLRPPFDREFVVGAFPTFNSNFIGFNCDKVDPHVRRAISLALDRREIVRTITNGGGMLSVGTVPAGLLGYVPPFADDIYRLDAAKEELRKAGIKPNSVTVELLVHERDNTELLGQLVQSQVAKIGIHVVIKKMDYNTVVSRMIKGETEAFALALEYVFSAPQPILINIFDSSKIPVPNFWHYKSRVVDAELKNLRQVDDQEKANQICQKIEKQIVDDAPAAFLYQLRNLVIYRKTVSGVKFNGHSIPLLWEARVGQ